MKLTDNIEILHEDNMELMKRYPDKYFDLAIVDPEYGINIANRNGSLGQKKGQGRITNYKKKDWDSKPAGKEYFEELFRVSKNQIIWGANYFVEHLPAAKNWVVWDKGQPEGVSFSMYELAFTSFQKGQAMIYRKTFASSCNKVANNYQLAKVYAKIHPAQKPVELYKWLLDKYAKQGDKILDTHLGSGSIAIACHDYGFELLACEIDVDYFDASCKRISDHISQLKIF
ncbi:DNA methyltransferase [Myroides odoratus]|uniref:DNA methyltransferase n=1 Tax=Myroides odoratus TaxID=256 RepID=UPI000765AC94|nr:DNA methyltransferase [Myroides odoratus]